MPTAECFGELDSYAQLTIDQPRDDGVLTRSDEIAQRGVALFVRITASGLG